jgi:serine/threonine-protein kinase
VALKLLHRRFSEDEGFVERFRREASAAAALQHPNVVSVYDRGEWDGTYYIAMEYLEGRSLKTIIRQEAPLDPLRAIDLTVQVLKAARFAHKRGIVHRDLKPHNVIVDEEGRAKVTDFGIAQAGASEMTETGAIIGTAQYLSPEQAQGQPVDARSDLYSVGVLLYELLTGRVPFDGDTAVAIAVKHVSQPPQPPRELVPSIPPELEQIVLWALNKDPADRPADADAFIAALEHARTQIAEGGESSPTAEFGALAAAAGLDAATPFAAAAIPPPPDHPAAAAERERRWWPWALLALALIGAAIAAYALTRPATRVVPAVVGESLAVATTQLQNAGLHVDVIRVTDPRPIDNVLSQDPLAGVKVDDGSTVTLKVSNGPGSGTVPSVVNLSQHQAGVALRKAGFKIAPIQHQSSDTVAKGRVISTSPGAGSQAQIGSDVTLVVSTGPAAKAVPAVVGKQVADATNDLIAAGFRVSTRDQQTTTDKPGTVLAQDPASGTRLQPGRTVTLTVAAAPTTASVPAVVGKSASDAVNALLAAGFVPHEIVRPVSSTAQDGIVISQTPAGGRQAKKGSRVTIVEGRYQAQQGSQGGSTNPTSGDSQQTPGRQTGIVVLGSP